MSKKVKLIGSQYFRQRLVCSTLSGRPILVEQIRNMDEYPGLRDYEANMLRLIEKISNGCKIDIDMTGTAMYYKPGILTGGRIEHDCGTTRSIGYFLEVLALLAPFCQNPLNISLTGITNNYDNLDISVDLFRVATLPLLNNFGIIDGLEFKITKRGSYPNGGGLVIFKCPIVRSIEPIELTDVGLVKRVRGISYTTRMSSHMATRVVDTAKGILLDYLSDIFIYTDTYKGKESGNSPGYGLSLVAETTTGVLICAETMARPGQVPEELAEETAMLLLNEVLRGGCVDTINQSLMLVFMTLTTEDVSVIRLGKLSPYTIQYLRNINKFFGVKFNIETDPETKTVLCTCIGSGFRNIARSVK